MRPNDHQRRRSDAHVSGCAMPARTSAPLDRVHISNVHAHESPPPLYTSAARDRGDRPGNQSGYLLALRYLAEYVRT